MNKTKIEWVRNNDGTKGYSWNPVTGCMNNCWYCYAAKIANRFGADYNKSDSKIHELVCYDGTIIDLKTEIDDPWGVNRLCVGFENSFPFKFEPTLHCYRLDDPKERRKGSKIFVCSMADLFGDWVPKEWINGVLETVKETPWHTYLFLTKNPKRYAEFLFPENCWLGMTLTGTEENQTWLWPLMSGMDNKKFISYEPLIGKPKDLIHYLIKPDWIIIGGLSPKPAHKEIWVSELIEEYRKCNIPIFLKDNLKWHEEIKEYPEWSN